MLTLQTMEQESSFSNGNNNKNNTQRKTTKIVLLFHNIKEMRVKNLGNQIQNRESNC